MSFDESAQRFFFGRDEETVELLRLICQELDMPFAPEFLPARVGDVLHSWADISATQRDLGYTVRVKLPEGLKQTLAYYKKSAPQPELCTAR